MRVRAGSLRDRLTLERPQYSPDGAGGRVETWVSVASVWGQVIAKSGSESVDAGRFSGSVSHEVTLRYRDDVKPTMRLVYGAKIFEIIGVLNQTNRKDWLTCLCVERDL